MDDKNRFFSRKGILGYIEAFFALALFVSLVLAFPNLRVVNLLLFLLPLIFAFRYDGIGPGIVILLLSVFSQLIFSGKSNPPFDLLTFAMTIFLYGMVGFIVLSYTQSQRKAEELIIRNTFYDSVTGLPDKTVLEDRMNVTLEHAKRNNEMFCIFYIDLHDIENLYGEKVRKTIIRKTAQILQNSVRKEDTVAKIDGNKFIVLLPEIKTIKDTKTVAEKIYNAISKRFKYRGNEITFFSSIGIATYPFDGQTSNVLLKNAYKAMTKAKKLRRNGYEMFNEFDVE